MNNDASPCRKSGDFFSLIVHDVACFEKLRINITTACYICCVHFSVFRNTRSTFKRANIKTHIIKHSMNGSFSFVHDVLNYSACAP